VTNRASFEHAEDWLKDVREHADPNLTCILVANKVDLVGEEDGLGGGSANASARASLDVPGAGEVASTIGRRAKKRREVGREEAELWAKERGASRFFATFVGSLTSCFRLDVLFIEASAKTGMNVNEVGILLLVRESLTCLAIGIRSSCPGHIAKDQARGI
jgi:Ras-related protein Rab-2A